MSLRNRIVTTIVIAFVVLAISAAAYYIFFHQSATTPRALLLYTNYQSPETITNWIINTDTGKRWEVGKGLAAWHWSPSGKYLVFHTLSPLPRQIWVSDFDGRNLHKVLDNQDYPELEIKNFEWLSDELIIVNVVSKAENSGLIYLFHVDTRLFERLRAGNFLRVSPNGNFWIQWTGRYELAGLDVKTIPLPDYLNDYYFSTAEDEIAYSCAGKYRFSSLCVVEVNMLGFTNNHKVVENAFLNAYGETLWSQDGRYIGFLYYSEEGNEIRFRAIDVSSGKTVYDWAFSTKDTRIFWSPRGDKIIDWGGLLLDLKTGKVSNFFDEIGETTPSHIVDWRMIDVP